MVIGLGSLLLTALAWLLSGLKTLLVAVFSKYAIPLFVALAAFLGFNYFAKDRILDAVQAYQEALQTGIQVETGTLLSALSQLQSIVQSHNLLQFGFYLINVKVLALVITSTLSVIFAAVTARMARSASSLALGRG